MNSFIMCLREQLRNARVKIIELSPPVVQSEFELSPRFHCVDPLTDISAELHNVGMGDEQGPKLGMPVEKFTDQALEGLVSGKDHVVIGSIGIGPSPAAEAFGEVVEKRNFAFEKFADMIRGRF